MFDRRVFSPYSRFFLNQGHCIENKIGTNTAQVVNTYSLTSYKWHIKNRKCACAHLYIHVHGKTSQLYLSIDWNFKLRVIARDQRVCTTITWCIFAYFSAIESSSTPSQTRLSLAHLRRQAHQLVRHPLIRALEIPHQQWREFFIFWCEKRKCGALSTCNSKTSIGASNSLLNRVPFKHHAFERGNMLAIVADLHDPFGQLDECECQCHERRQSWPPSECAGCPDRELPISRKICIIVQSMDRLYRILTCTRWAHNLDALFKCTSTNTFVY